MNVGKADTDSSMQSPEHEQEATLEEEPGADELEGRQSISVRAAQEGQRAAGSVDRQLRTEGKCRRVFTADETRDKYVTDDPAALGSRLQ